MIIAHGNACIYRYLVHSLDFFMMRHQVPEQIIGTSLHVLQLKSVFWGNFDTFEIDECRRQCVDNIM